MVLIATFSYGHLPVLTGYFYGMRYILTDGVLLVLITDKWP